MIAEIALFVDGDINASGNAMLSGIAKSFDKVTNFRTKICFIYSCCRW